MRCTKFFFQPEVVRNQNLQLLCYVIFFDILHHYGVIAASQICSVSRKYCAVLRNRFFFLFFRHDFVRTISLEPLLAETPNSVCCFVLRSNFALLLTIQFASLFLFLFFFLPLFCLGYISGTVTCRDSKLSVLLSPAV